MNKYRFVYRVKAAKTIEAHNFLEARQKLREFVKEHINNCWDMDIIEEIGVQEE